MNGDIQQEFLDYCEWGDIDKAKDLLKDPRFDPSGDNNYAIRYASYYGHLEVVRELLKDPHIDPSDGYNQAIRISSMYGHIDVVKELLKDPRVDPSVYNNYAIIFSSENGHSDVLKELLKNPRIDKQKLLDSNIKNKLRNEVLEYLNEVRDKFIDRVLDTDI